MDAAGDGAAIVGSVATANGSATPPGNRAPDRPSGSATRWRNASSSGIRGALDDGAEHEVAEVAVHRLDAGRGGGMLRRQRDQLAARIGVGTGAEAAEELDVRGASRGVAEQLAHRAGGRGVR